MYEYNNKQNNIGIMNKYMLVKTLSMFKYSGLPETISDVELEKMLQQNGYAFLTEHKDDLYIFNGGIGGIGDVYNNPTEIIINNPYLKLNKTYNLKDDGVLIKNDDLMLGLIPLYEKFHSLMIENEITMYVASHLARIPMLISAGDDNTKESAEKFLADIVEGNLGVIGENRLFEGIKSQSTSSHGNVSFTQLIEVNQYLKASLYNEVGLNANFNMKRERLNSSEVDLNEDNLFPLVDNMINNREKAVALLNEKYGLNVTVEFNSSWDRSGADIIESETSANVVNEVLDILEIEQEEKGEEGEGEIIEDIEEVEEVEEYKEGSV